MTAEEQVTSAQAILRRDIMPQRKVELLEQLLGTGEQEPAPSNVGAEPASVTKPGEQRDRAKAAAALPDSERSGPSAPGEAPSSGEVDAVAPPEPEPATDPKPEAAPRPPARSQRPGRRAPRAPR